MAVKPLRCITTFDAIVDTDLGLVRLVLDEFNNPEFLKKGADKIKYNLTGLRALLADREQENPLSAIMVSRISDQFDSLREQFMESYYEQILSLSGDTSITKVLAVASKSQSLVETTVLCNSQIEIDYLTKRKFPGKFILATGDVLGTEQYGEFYLKRLSDVALFEPLRVKNIFTLEYKFNLDKDNSVLKNHQIKDEYLYLIENGNSIYTMIVYPELESLKRKEETTNGNK